jgi:hypothetical protein
MFISEHSKIHKGGGITMYFDNIISSSSEVEVLKEKEEIPWVSMEKILWVGYGPNHGGQYVSMSDLKVIIDSRILSGNTNPRFINSGKNLLLFGAESYRVEFLKKMGFKDKWIEENLLPEQPLAQVIPLFPEKENEEESNEPEPLSAAL